LRRCKSKEKGRWEDSLSEEEEIDVMVKVEEDESSFSRNSRRNFVAREKREAKSRPRNCLKRHGRTTMIRQAKARAEQLIHSVIEEHFD
jgi:hypothetical protein